ncbi:MAG TPA: hypothetical protein VIV12_22230 [Streptosporangiaceae bacterium]
MPGRRADIAVTAVLAALAWGAAVVGAPTAVTIVLGIALFALPGYLLGELLLGSSVAGLERVAVVTGLAFAVPILGGLLLSAAGIPLDRGGWLGLLSGATLVADVALLLRRRGHRAAAFRSHGPLRPRRTPAFAWPPGSWPLPPRHAAAFGAAVVVAAGGLGLAVMAVSMQPTPGFTGLSLSARNEHALVASLEVSNQQGATTRYRLILLRDGRVSAAWSFTLSNGKTWQRTVPYTRSHAIVANLYRLPDLTQPYRHVAAASDRALGS